MKYICTPKESMFRILTRGQIVTAIYKTNKRFEYIDTRTDDYNPFSVLVSCENKPMDMPRYGIYWKEYIG